MTWTSPAGRWSTSWSTPAYLPRIRAANDDLARRCALESTRLAQRSIMTRAVLSPVRVDAGDVTYEVPPGWLVSTLLPLLNTAAPDLTRWDPIDGPVKG